MDSLRTLRLGRRQRRLIWLLALIAALMCAAAAIMLHLKPLVTNLAASRVNNRVNRIVVAAVNEAIARGDIRYDALITFEKDDSGHVTALKSNMAEFNRLQVGIADDILERLGDVSTNELRIPIGTLTGASLLAGRGPELVVKMQSMGSAAAKLRNEFSAAGINQTKHQILLDVDVTMSILLPGYTTYTVVSNEVVVAETIIVGNVPESYTYFNAAPEETDEYAEEYILNKG